MTRWGMLAVVGLATAMGAGCGSSSGGGTNDGSGGGPVGGGGESRDGEVYSPEPLVSNVDGEAIAVSVPAACWTDPTEGLCGAPRLATTVCSYCTVAARGWLNSVQPS